MKILENITHYQCDYCGKKMVRKHAMINHEPNCYSNPENKRACSGCSFLEEIQIDYMVQFGGPDGVYEEERQVKGFKCKKLNQTMYPFKAERNGLPDLYPETFANQVPMPKTCKHHTFDWEH